MAEFPLLSLPIERASPDSSRPGFGQQDVHHPGRQRQVERIGPVFQRLSNLLNGGQDELVLGDDPNGLAPERVIVFEVAGSITNFAAACSRVGLEYLTEQELKVEPDEDFWVVDKRKQREGKRRDDQPIAGRIYAAMPDLQAMEELLSLWQRYEQGKQEQYGFKSWFDLFEHLHALRTWGPEDRVSDETLEDFRHGFHDDQDGAVTIEVELWFRERRERYEDARRALREAVDEANGEIISEASIRPIAYQAALVKLPREALLRIIGRENVHLVVCRDIMFIRPQCNPAIQPSEGPLFSPDMPAGQLPDKELPPIAALLDGVPIQRHQALKGRVTIDDPEGLEDRSLVQDRKHGTAMASLIIHGEIGQKEPPLSRVLHIRPVMYAVVDGQPEILRPDRLVVDTIYRAVRRLKAGSKGENPTAPGVFLVNLSLGDQGRPYAGWISPWARLLDYLAYEYNILFLVSAGNIRDPLPIPRIRRLTDFEDVTPESREEAVLHGLGQQRSRRTLLSPAEALNVITVGAAHAGGEIGVGHQGGPIDPYNCTELPNISSALGLGHLRAIKPDILMPGGREHVQPRPRGQELTIVPAPAGRGIGISAAAPDVEGNLGGVRLQSGTSVAAALATRMAHRLYEALMDRSNGGVLIRAEPLHYALVIRAFLVHGASWPQEIAGRIEEIYGPNGRYKHAARRDNVARILGYGAPGADGIQTCTPERATLVGYGQLKDREVAVCRIPLPPCVTGVGEPRMVTITLAWFAPVNARNRLYRMARFEVKQKLETEFGTPSVREQPGFHSTKRGTIWHRRFKGSKALQFVEDGKLKIEISCRVRDRASDASIPYGLVVSIEAESGVPLYQEIRDRLVIRPAP